MEIVQVTLLMRTLASCTEMSSRPNALVAISKGMWAVNPCCDKILQFLSGMLSN